MDLDFIDPSPNPEGVIAVPVFADRTLSSSAQMVDAATGGYIATALGAIDRFKGNRDDVAHVFPPSGPKRVVLYGTGEPAKLDGLAWERLGGGLQAQLEQAGVAEATIYVDAPNGAPVAGALAAAHVGAGARLRSYRFDRYKTKEKPESKPSLAKISLAASASAGAEFAPISAAIDGVFLTRDLVSEPPNALYPASFADRCRELSASGLDVQVLGESELEAKGMGALLGVGRGSDRESKVVTMTWAGGNDGDAPVAFVGKGVTFDTGGISLKPPAGMEDMKWDMGGAGTVTGLMLALARRNAKVNAVGVLGLVENMPSGSAQRPGDVVTSMSGQTIEVINTDAEGRLVLADALWYVQESFQPKAIIDLATLTGAIIISLGHEHAGLFANDDALADQLLTAGRETGDKLWRMPLDDAYDKEIDSQIADMRNVAGARWAGSVIAAQFLKRFVKKVPWAHLDIAGTTWSTKGSPTAPKGGTGFGVRLLDKWVATHHER